MAIYHFSAQIISRSQGRSSVAASAYRAGEKIKDERTDLSHDYTRKNDVVKESILLPEEAPQRLSDRACLWNEVENTEKRKDSQVAREINISLPKEFNNEQNWDLLESFVQREFVNKGMVADVSFHRGHESGQYQPHGHVMLTMREVSSEGFGQKVRSWNDRSLLQNWREGWAEHCNRELARQGHDMRIDHRSLEDQGINLEPQSKIGPAGASRRMARFAEHQEIAKRNGERIIADPGVALKALTQQQSTFSQRDIARLSHRHSVDKEQFDQVFEKIKAHPELVKVGRDSQGNDRFSTQEMINIESKMIHQALEKSQQSQFEVSAKHAEAAFQGKGMSDQQKAAFDHVVRGADLACVSGYAGTGKSHMLGSAREAWQAQGFNVQGMALSGIAAENLEGGSEISSRTVASQLWYWDKGLERLGSKDVVVVDEAGMLGSRQMGQIVDAVGQAGAKLVLVGDPEQLQAIEAGAAYRGISERVGFAEMTDIRRQQEPWQQHATRDFASQQTHKGFEAYQKHGHVHVFPTQERAISEMVERWSEVCNQSANTSQIMLAYTRDEVRTLNEQARLKRQGQQELGPDHTFETSRGARDFAVQDQVIFLRNENKNLGVKNGTLGTIKEIKGDTLTVSIDKKDQQQPQEIRFSIKDYNDLDHGYATTVHKSQGSTVDRSHVLASSYFDRHSSYVAMSRHRDGADLYYSEEKFPSFKNLSESLSKERVKDTTLDYGLEDKSSINKLNPEKKNNRDIGQEISTNIREQIANSLGHRVEDTQKIQATAKKDMSKYASLEDFKTKFESKSPSKAQELVHSILPKQDRPDPEKTDQQNLEKSDKAGKSDKSKGLTASLDKLNSSFSNQSQSGPKKEDDRSPERDR